MSAGGGALPAGFALVERDVVDSTNAEARRFAEAGAAQGTVVRAAVQAAGKGRSGRSWQSPRGNLYASILLRPDFPLDRTPLLALLAAVALGEGLVRVGVAQERVTYKWPNDVLIDGRKVAGLLLETVGAGSAAAAPAGVILGSGVNVASHPPATRYGATHLAAELTQPVSLDDLLAAYVARLAAWLTICTERGDTEAVRRAWLAKAAYLGEQLRVTTGTGSSSRDQAVAGAFVDVDASGGMILERPGGARETVRAGDVVHVHGA